jgi:hypothetical protein
VNDLHMWAVKGAEQRLVEIAEETRVILATFPELKTLNPGLTDEGRRGDKAPISTAAPRRRRKMSAAARKRIGDAQRARWAKQKATSGAAPESMQPASRVARKKR